MIKDSTSYIFDYTDKIKAKQDSIWHEELFSFSKKESASVYTNIDSISTKNTVITHSKENKGHAGDYKVFSLEQDDGIFALLLISFLCITRIYNHGSSFFTENVRILFSTRKELSPFIPTTIKEFWFNFILIFQSILLGSIIAFDYILNLEKNTQPIHSFYTILLFIGTIGLFLGIKYSIYKLIGYIFNIRDRIQIWLRSYMITIEMLGIVAFIPVLVLIYSQQYYTIVISFLICLFIVSRMIIFYRIIVFFMQSNVNLLFLIAYLCALEIIPYIFLYNILVFLYKIDLTSLLWL